MRRFHCVYEIEHGYIKVFVIKGSQNILVDTGSRPLPDEVIAFMGKSGFRFDDEAKRRELRAGSYQTITDFLEREKIGIDLIICTHCHGDHIGNLRRLKQKLGAPAAMHPFDIPFVDGSQTVTAPHPIPPEIARHLTVETCPVEIALQDDDRVTDDVRIIHVPGHTRGSICLLVQDRVLLTGDCVTGRNQLNPMMGQRELNPPVELFSMDYAVALESLKRLRGFDFDSILTGHGASIATHGKETLERLLHHITP